MFNKLTIINIPKVTSEWKLTDYLGTIKVRSSIGRNAYTVEPGLYKFGNPDSQSAVFASANYKLSFDILRKNLEGLNAWILVLDTKGINVWCAAGKGTFGTNELIHRIKETKLSDYISHKTIILPQLGASGIAAYYIRENTGFNVKFGPVRARDIKEYIDKKYQKSEEMRQVSFNLTDRLILTPVEIMNSFHYLLILLLATFILSGITSEGYKLASFLHEGMKACLMIGSAYISGTILVPLLLPWIPSRYFAGKGIIVQTLMFLILLFPDITNYHILNITGWYFFTTSLSSYLAMNFTGSTTFTSLSGVKKEMKLFIPIQIFSFLTGLIMIIVSKFINL